MTDPMLHDRRILVVEDEDILACALETELLGAGAIVLGPVGFLEDALLLIRSEPQIDCVILDVNLQGKTTFSVAELLVERQVPFILANVPYIQPTPMHAGAAP